MRCCLHPSATLPDLSALDVLWAAADVHGHRHDNLQPSLHGSRPPLRHGRRPGQLHLLETVQLVLRAVRQAETGGAAEAVRVCEGGPGEGDDCGWKMCSGCGCEWRQRWQWPSNKEESKVRITVWNQWRTKHKRNQSPHGERGWHPKHLSPWQQSNILAVML